MDIALLKIYTKIIKKIAKFGFDRSIYEFSKIEIEDDILVIYFPFDSKISEYINAAFNDARTSLLKSLIEKILVNTNIYLADINIVIYDNSEYGFNIKVKKPN